MSSGTLTRRVNLNLRAIFLCSNDFLHFLRWKSELNLPRENWRTDAVVVLRPVVVYRKKSKQQRGHVRSAKQYIHHLFFFESMETLWIPRSPVHKTINRQPFQVEWSWTFLLGHFDYWYLIICQSWIFFFFYCINVYKLSTFMWNIGAWPVFRRLKKWTPWSMVSLV